MLSVLSDWNLTLGLFLTHFAKHAPAWPEVQTGDRPVKLPISNGCITQARLAECAPELGAESFPLHGQDKVFNLYELVEFLVSLHKPQDAKSYITQLSWMLGSHIEKKLMMMLDPFEECDCEYSISAVDHTKFGFSDENDNRILIGHLDASVRASEHAIKEVKQKQKVKHTTQQTNTQTKKNKTKNDVIYRGTFTLEVTFHVLRSIAGL